MATVFLIYQQSHHVIPATSSTANSLSCAELHTKFGTVIFKRKLYIQYTDIQLRTCDFNISKIMSIYYFIGRFWIDLIPKLLCHAGQTCSNTGRIAVVWECHRKRYAAIWLMCAYLAARYILLMQTITADDPRHFPPGRRVPINMQDQLYEYIFTQGWPSLNVVP